jgi:dipeptidyl aminopeptidase/acylaminoacyl peptidase
MREIPVELLSSIKKIGLFHWKNSSIYFISDINGTWDIWKINLKENYPKQVTVFSGNVMNFKVSPDGQKIAFLSEKDRSEKYNLSVTDSRGRMVKTLATEGIIEITDLDWCPHSDRIAFISKIDKNYNIHIISTDTDRDEQITDSVEFKRDVRWSPRGNYIAFFSMARKKEGHIAVISPENRKMLNLTSGLKGINSYPRWSPDGKSIVFVSDNDGVKRAGIISFPDGNITWLPEEEYEQNLPEWSRDGKNILYISNREGNMDLKIFNIHTQKSERAGFIGGVTSGAQWSPDGKSLAFRYHSARIAPEIFVSSDNNIKRLTHSAPAGVDEHEMVEAELIYYKSFDNKEIPAFFYKPSISGNYPCLLWLHGGPASQHFNGWNPFIQLVVSRGISVLAPNIRGSTGQGRDVEYALYRNWGGPDLEDVAAAAEYLRNLDSIDSNRIAIGGGSYGGYITMMALVKYPDLWAAGINAVGPVNLASFYKNTTPWMRNLLIDKYGFIEPEKDEKFYYERSPVNFIENLKAPLLLIYNEKDVRVPVSEMEQLLEKLKNDGKDFETFFFYGEGHSSLKSESDMKRYSVMSGFLVRKLK